MLKEIPHDKSPESSLLLLRDGYNFIIKRCLRYKSDLFETRLLFQRTICMRGEEAAKLFYDNERFMRKGANPGLLQKTLTGVGAVHNLDDEAHRVRKQMFMSLMAPERIQNLAALVAKHWDNYLQKWEKMDKVTLFPEVQEILCRAVCEWAGVPLEEGEVKQKTVSLAGMVDGAGSAGLRHMWARVGRRKAERWIGELVEKVRAGKLNPPDDSALKVIACHRYANGQLLDKHTAAVEVINVLRPVVAISWFITFSAHALHEYPECRQKLQTEDEPYLEWFVQEVRRFYPFFPLVAARTRKAFEWQGYQFPEGRRVFLDLYSTDHDGRIWERPDEFEPERFGHWNKSAFNFIPHGGGDHYTDHRCPGEWITIEVMKTAAKCLSRSMTFKVPEQSLKISMARIPALPKSRFVISRVRRFTPDYPRQ